MKERKAKMLEKIKPIKIQKCNRAAIQSKYKDTYKHSQLMATNRKYQIFGQLKEERRSKKKNGFFSLRLILIIYF